MRNYTTPLAVAAILLIVGTSAPSATRISGELKTWHKVTLTFDGPEVSEEDEQNPFTDYRLNVTFSKDNKTYRVPGYFAADGDAANTEADSGNKWRVHFAPSETGNWDYVVSFRKGPNVAVNDDPQAGVSAGYMDGEKGRFSVKASDKKARDFRSKGRLQYVGGHYLRFAGTGEYFLKAGPDAPETFLAYMDFDNTVARKKNAPLKTWQPHVQDWRQGDPTWKEGKGKGMIGALNYLASKGCNVFSFLPYNAGGDGDNVWPFRERDDKLRYDCSKLDQWGIVFDHATRLGLYLHFKLQENEIDDNRRGDKREEGLVPESLDGGKLGVERKLYCRELIARFAHNLALNWNIGEENTQSTEEIVDMVRYLHETDPYRNHIVIHTFPGDQDRVYTPLLGDKSLLTGASLQNGWNQTHARTLKWVVESDKAGRPWVVANDEQGPASLGVPVDPGYKGHSGKAGEGNNAYDMHDIRKATLWGNLMAGGAGVEYYFGYQLPENDLVCEDFRSRDQSWDYCRIALAFFQKHEIPFWEMKNDDGLTRNPDDYCFIKPGELYLIYFKNPGELKLSLESGDLTYGWFDPKTGNGLDGLLEQGKAKGPAQVTLKTPGDGDWLLCLKKAGPTELSFKDVTEVRTPAVAVDEAPKSPYLLVATRDVEAVTGSDFVPFYKDNNRKALAINAAQHKDKFAAARAVFAGESGTYDIALTTLTETDGESTYRLLIGGKAVGTYTNPATQEDYQPAGHTWRNVPVKKDDVIQVEFNTASNKKQPEGSGFAYSRGRWTHLAFRPAGRGDVVFEEHNGLVAGEAELFFEQTQTSKRKWYVTTAENTPAVHPDGDDNHAASAGAGAYIEVLPDTRRTHADKLINGENFSNEPGQMAVVSYKVHFNTPGRYYVWVRAYSTGSEDNGLHVGLDGDWPESGRRLQWCDGKNSWWWESKQRTEAEHCGEPYKIYLDVKEPGLHIVSFSMREDGFEFDKWLMTTDREMKRPGDEGPATRFRKTDGTL